jgi:hypothetical protein
MAAFANSMTCPGNITARKAATAFEIVMQEEDGADGCRCCDALADCRINNVRADWEFTNQSLYQLS